MGKTIFFEAPLYASILAAVAFILYYITDKKIWRSVALTTILASVVCLTVFMIKRWIHAGRPPLSNSFESMVFFAWSAMLIMFVIELLYRPPVVGAAIALMVTFTLAYTDLAFPSEITNLMPALQNNFWLTIHVILCFIGYSAFMVSFVSGMLYLYGAEKPYAAIASYLTGFTLVGLVGGLIFILARRSGAIASSEEAATIGKLFLYLIGWIVAGGVLYFPISIIVKKLGLQDKPEMVKKQNSLMIKAVTFAFPFLTLGIITGSVWANQAWGRYWGWDPKETWSLITWIIFAIFLHMKYAGGWMGIKPKHMPYVRALIAVIGFLAVVFTFFGVNYLLSGLHSYA